MAVADKWEGRPEAQGGNRGCPGESGGAGGTKTGYFDAVDLMPCRRLIFFVSRNTLAYVACRVYGECGPCISFVCRRFSNFLFLEIWRLSSSSSPPVPHWVQLGRRVVFHLISLTLSITYMPYSGAFYCSFMSCTIVKSLQAFYAVRGVCGDKSNVREISSRF